MLSRVHVHRQEAKNPNAAKVWTDYMLSKRGQKIIASDVELFAIRTDVDGRITAASLNKQLGSNVKPIPVSSEIVLRTSTRRSASNS